LVVTVDKPVVQSRKMQLKKVDCPDTR
jgi:hypothetical protein